MGSSDQSQSLLRRLVVVGRALAETRDRLSIFRAVRGSLAEIQPFDTFLVTLLDAEGRTRHCVYCWGDGVEVDTSRFAPLPLNDGQPSRALLTGEPVVCDDLPSELPPGLPLFNVGDDPRRTRSYMIVPMSTGGRVIGSLQLQSYDSGRYTLADAEPVEVVAGHAAAALENERLLNEAEEAQRSAARSREELARTFEAMADAVVLVDAGDRVVRANASYWEITSRGPATLGKVLSRTIHGDEDAIRDCEICSARIAGREGTFVVLVPSADEPLGRHFEVKLNRVTDGDGSFVGMVQVLRDVTALRTAEAELTSRQAILDSVLSSTTDTIGLLDLGGRVVWVNDAVSRFGGARPEALRGKAISEFFKGEAERLVATLLARVRAGETVQFEHAFTRPDGSPLLVELALSPVVELGRVTGVVGTARDITERRASMERISEGEKLRALGQLAAGVAHDFNNLLASILGYTQLLARHPALAEPSVARKLAAVEQAARDGAETVRRIQNFTREGGERAHESIRVSDLLRHAVDLARPRWKDQAQATGRLVRVDVESVDADLTVRGSGAELREVMTNLVFNALDAMPDGGWLKLSGGVEQDWVVLRVADSGHGIDEQTRRRIFEPFFTTRGPQNSGLGLAVSYGIVRRHGGVIEVASDPSVETVFTVRLPLSGLAPPRAAAPTVPPRLRGRVLVVDDEPMVLDVIADALRGAGGDVTAVASGREAVAALARAPFDVVVTDLGMPDINGWDIARAAAEAAPRPRVLLLTGWGATLPDDAAGGLVERVLAKPIDLDDLVAIVARSS